MNTQGDTQRTALPIPNLFRIKPEFQPWKISVHTAVKLDDKNVRTRCE
jgi:hypothetical protein